MPMPKPGRILDHRTFAVVLDLEIAKAQRLHYEVTILCLRPDRGKLDPDRLIMMANAVTAAVRVTDVIALLPPNAVTMLAVAAEPPATQSLVDRITESLRGVIHDETVTEETTWSVGAASYPKLAGPGALLLQHAVRQMVAAHGAGGNRLYIAS